jgi:hypothetical protein
MPTLNKSLEDLFISKVRIKALKFFLFNVDRKIHLRETVRELKEEINAVRRELNRMEAIGLLTCEQIGNKKFYALNKDYGLLYELMGIFHKTFGVGGQIIKNANKLGNVKFAIITDSFYMGEQDQQRIDLVLIGQVNLDVISDIVSESESKLNREIHYTVLKDSEFILRKKRRDTFIMDLLMSNKITILGNPRELGM